MQIESLEQRQVLSLTPLLLADINPGAIGVQVDSRPVDLDGVAYFAGHVQGGLIGNDSELWRSDGTAAGTQLVRDIRPGLEGSIPFGLTSVNGSLLFFATDENGVGLWKSDGTALGTTLVKSLPADNSTYFPRQLTNVNGTLFFSAQSDTHRFELWKSDGTAAGTMVVHDIVPNFDSKGARVDQLTNVSGTLFFTANELNTGEELWKSDGTDAGTVLVKDLRPGTGWSSPYALTNVNGTLFFVNGADLWKSDGTDAGTALVSAMSDRPNRLTAVGSTLFFDERSPTTGQELWKSDGTDAGTFRVKDINPGAANSYPKYLTNVSGILFFQATDGVHGRELWKSDGTAAGTVMTKDVAEIGESDPEALTNIGGTLYFRTNDSIHGIELWKSDGTITGTVLVSDARQGVYGIYPDLLGNVGGHVFFAGNDSVGRKVLWTSDGTAAGTFALGRDTSGGSSPSNFLILGSVAYFSADDGIHGRELWRTDGTAAGTYLVSDISLGSGDSNPQNLTNINGTIYFQANDGIHGEELWKTDGTAAGTTLVSDIRPGGGSSYPKYMTEMNGRVFFQAAAGANDIELWSTDGTAAGTIQVADIRPGTSGSQPRGFVNFNGTLFFNADSGNHHAQLWKSDGTAAGTVLVKEISRPASVYSDPPAIGLTSFNGTLFFRGNDADHGSELWTSDGTAAGTVMIKDINVGPYSSNPSQLVELGGKLLFVATDNSYNSGIWTTDGTQSGTVLVKEIGPYDFRLANFTKVGGAVFFTSTQAGGNYVDLWKTDGTTAGTIPVKASTFLQSPSQPQQLTNVNGLLLFTVAYNGGGQLWQSDGTDAGTFMTSQVRPGNNDVGLMQLQNLNGRLILTADDGVHGRELFMAANMNSAPSFTPSGDVNVKDEWGPQVILWARDAIAGPPDEAGQTLIFDVGNNNPDIFAVQPTIDSGGRLHFTPQPNSAGSAIVTVVLRDNGGTAAGGADRTTTQSFTINVTKEHPGHDAYNAFDVNNDRAISTIDALLVINQLNAFGPAAVDPSAPIGAPYFDVSADGHISALDALMVIDYLNAHQSGTAQFLGADTVTQGDWQYQYGSEGYDLNSGAVNLPSYAQLSLSGEYDYVWAASTSDPRALQQPGSTDRLAAAWTGHNSDSIPLNGFTLDLNLTDGKTHRVAIYIVDWDTNDRSQRMDVLDGDTGQVLDSRSAVSFHDGFYYVWNLTGHVKIRFTNLANGLNAVASGIFFG